MACNCGTQEEINKLYKKYGYKLDVSKKNTLKHNITSIVQYMSALILALLFAPFFLLYIIYKDFDDDRKIDIIKILTLNKKLNAR